MAKGEKLVEVGLARWEREKSEELERETTLAMTSSESVW